MGGWIFTHILLLIGVACGWMNPFVGLMVYWAFALLRPHHLWFWAFDQGSPPRLSILVALSLLVGWALKGFGDWSSIRHVKLPVFCILLYLFSGLVAFALSPAQAGWMRAYSWSALDVQIKIVLMVVVTLTLLRDARQVRIFAWVVVASLGYLAWSMNVLYLDNPTFLITRGFGGIDNNGAAMIMVMGVPVTFFMAINDRRLWVKGLCLIAGLCLVHGVLFSFSRGAQLGLMVVGGSLFVVSMLALPRKALTLSLAIAFLVFAFIFAGPEVREEFASIFVGKRNLDASAASRFVLWKAGWAAMLDHPLGLGPRVFNLFSHQYGLPHNKSIHNLFLQTGADYGFLGALGLTGFYFTTAVSCLFASRLPAAKRLGWPRYFCHMVAIAIGGFLMCSMFIGMESVEVGYIISALGLCTVAHVRRIHEEERAVDTERLPELAQVAYNEDDLQLAVG